MTDMQDAGAAAPRELDRTRERIARLERRVRALSLCGALAVATLLLVALAPGQGPVETSGLVVRDAAGRARIRLGVAADVPSLSLYDANGVLRAALAVDDEGPILNLFAPGGEPRLVAAERAARSFVILRDAGGAPRAAMAVQENGEPSLYLLDADLNPIWRQPARK